MCAVLKGPPQCSKGLDDKCRSRLNFPRIHFGWRKKLEVSTTIVKLTFSRWIEQGSEEREISSPPPHDVWTVFDPSSPRCVWQIATLSRPLWMPRCEDDGGGGGGYYQSKRLGINPLWCEFAQCSIRNGFIQSSLSHSLFVSQRERGSRGLCPFILSLNILLQMTELLCSHILVLPNLILPGQWFLDASATAPWPH